MSSEQGTDPLAPERKVTVADVRRLVAQLMWLACSIAALVLALGALMVSFGANTDNGLVRFVLDAAAAVDLGVFDRDQGVKQWTGENAQTKNALLNWGLAALVWLIAGRVLDRLIRPSSPQRRR
ncbi:MAG TPA: hypothetical protein VGE38_02275 [Nocardioides sp.]|uniref:hypothetical protein n=1 Tax=Nocardioides sp. TaxID=35761 RepID=UPI002EDBA90C